MLSHKLDLVSVENIIEKITDKRNELKLIEFLAEHCLYLLWAHLDFFVLRAIPINTHQINYNRKLLYNFFYIHMTHKH